MEIEAKIPLTLKNLSKLRATLKSIDAIFAGRALEKNWLFDHLEQTLVRADKLLRIREDRRVLLTFKGPRERSEYKKREEREIEFPNVADARALLEAVGFIQWFYYEKIRETWKLGVCEVVLDEMPEIGLFVEIEGPGTQEIEKAIKQLKLKRELISSSYVELFRDFSARAGKPIAEFRFPTGYKYVLGVSLIVVMLLIGFAAKNSFCSRDAGLQSARPAWTEIAPLLPLPIWYRSLS